MTDDERRRLMDAGAAAFERGEFYEAHESWEEVWDVLDDPERRWVQGMIQVATGLHKLGRFRSDVCRTLLGKALVKLADAPPSLDGIDLDRLRADAQRIADGIDRGERMDAHTVRLHRTHDR